jgi:hypothetical protein
MAELRRATVEFDKYKKRGRVYVKFSTELYEHQDRIILIEKVKEGVETALTKDDFSWSNLFKVTEVPLCYNGPSWIEFRLNLLRAHRPLEWDEEQYKARITRKVRQLCHLVKKHVDFIEKYLLQEEFPEVSKTIQFVEDQANSLQLFDGVFKGYTCGGIGTL